MIRMDAFKFLKPPKFENEDKTQKAFLLHIILWTLMIIPVFLFVYTLLFSGEVSSRFLIQVFSALGINVFLLLWMRRGHVRSASLIQVAAFWIFFTISAWTAAGVRHEAYQIGYALAITIAGLLLGMRGALIMVGLSVLSGGLMIMASDMGLWSFGPPNQALTIWVVSAVLFPVLAVIQFLGARRLRLALVKSQLSEAKYRLLADNITDHLWLMDLKFEPTYISPSVEKSRGYTFEEFARLPLEKRVAATSIQPAMEYFEAEMPKVIADPAYYPLKTLELEVFRKDGSTLWMETNYTAIRDAEGNPTSILGVGRDITGRKQAEEVSRKSEERFRLLAENARDTIWTMDLNLQYTYMSPYVKQTLDYTPEEYIALPLNEVLTPSSLETCMQCFAEELENEKKDDKDLLRSRTMELEHIGRNGKIVPVEMKLTFIRNSDGQATGILGYTRDISDRKQAEEALRKSEDKYRTLIETTGTGFVIIDQNGLVQDANTEYVRLTGYQNLNEIIGRSVIEWTADYEKEKNAAAVKTCFAEGSIRNLEIDYVDAKGKITPIEINATCIEIDGETHTLTVCRDITERKRTSDALMKSEEKFRKAYDTSPDAININRLSDGLYVSINPGFTRITGYTENDIIENKSITFDIWNNSDDRKRLVAGLRKDGEVRNLEAAFRTKSGEIRYGLMSASVIDLNGVPHILSITRDMTDHKKAEDEKRTLEERLQRAEKMEALGTLAGGVAHDLNNVLGVILGYSELLLNEIDKSSPIRTRLTKIMNGSEKAAAIVQDLLTLARRGVAGRKVLNLNKIILDYKHSPEMEKLSSYNPAAHIKLNLDAGLLNISASSVHLGKIISNLVSNALDAMPRGGELIIQTANQYLDKPVYGYDAVREGDYVVLTVTDTGEGIPAADLHRIFEPFYTKKVMGKSGTGLGLAVIWGTVKDHQGYIDVQSEEGKGSTFTLYFPVTREAISMEADSIAVSEYIGKGETILIVDDVKEQRDLASEMLNKLNYKVSSVPSGEDAIDYIRQHKIDLLVLDMIMDPGMDGLDTYKKVLEVQPKQKAIIVSGFSETVRVNEAHALGAGEYLKKPFIIEKLGLAVRKELDRK